MTCSDDLFERHRELVGLAVVAASRIGRHTTALWVRTALAPDLNAGQRAAVLPSEVEAILEMDDEAEKKRLPEVLGTQLTQEQAWLVADVHPVRVLEHLARKRRPAKRLRRPRRSMSDPLPCWAWRQ